MAGKNAQDGFNRFVEGTDQRRDAPLDESKKDFWDSFSSLADDQQQQKRQSQTNSSIGTSAMRKPGGGGAGTASGGQPANKNEDWDDW